VAQGDLRPQLWRQSGVCTARCPRDIHEGPAPCRVPRAWVCVSSRVHPAVRVLLYGRYRIVYKVEGANVYILGVFHGALDLKRHLQLK